MSSITSGGFARVLKNRRFLLLWLAQVISNLGDGVVLVAMLVYVSGARQPATSISILTLVELVPMVVLGPLAGVFVDRWDRKSILVVADLLRGVIFVALWLYPTNNAVFVAAFLAALASLFFSPARGAIIPDLVAGEELTAAVGLSQTTRELLQLLGPALGGALAGFLGSQFVFGFDGLTFFVSAFAIALIALPRKATTFEEQRALLRGGGEPAAHPMDPEEEPSSTAIRPAGAWRQFWQELVFGLQFLRRAPVLWFVTGMLTVISAVSRFGYIGQLQYMRHDLALDPARFGLVMSLTGAGAAAGALVMGNLGERIRQGWFAYLGFTLMMAGYVVFWFQPGYSWLLVLAAATGLLESTAMVPLTAIFYRHTPSEVRGKVFSVTNSLMNGSGLIVLPLAGVVTGWLGSAQTVALAGAAGVIWLLAMLLVPGARVLLGSQTPAPGEAVTGAVSEGQHTGASPV